MQRLQHSSCKEARKRDTERIQAFYSTSCVTFFRRIIHIMMSSSSSGVADGAAPSSPPAHHFEIGDEEDEHDEHQMMTSNGNHGDGSGEQPFEDGIENGGGDNDAPSPYQVFQTPVNVDYAESSVVAPCDLPEFHNLRVDLGRGRILVVQVPFGGAKKGDTFSAPYRIYDKPDEGNREYMPSVDSPRNRTVGAWRASLCGCCEFGPCHPTSLGAFICQCCKLPMIRDIIWWAVLLVSPWFCRFVSTFTYWLTTSYMYLCIFSQSFCHKC